MKYYLDLVIEELERALENPGQLRGISSGYSILDRLSYGFQNGQMYVIAGRQSVGKTALAMNIVEHIAVDQRQACAVFTMAMSVNALVRRLLVSRAKIPLQDLMRGVLSSNQIQALTEAAQELGHSALYLEEIEAIDAIKLSSKARRLKLQRDIRFIVIDSFQDLIDDEQSGRKARRMELARISRELKALAEELNVPVLVTAQLDDARQPRQGQRPNLYDLGEAMPLIRDAAFVGLLTRADYDGGRVEFETEDEESTIKSRANLIIAKNRDGPVGDVLLHFIDFALHFAETEP